MNEPFRIFVGWDRREPEAYDVCKLSLERRSSISLDVRPIVLDELRQEGLYWREVDPLASTDFTYSRFLTPALAGYQGIALFCDCDFLWLADVADLLGLFDPAKAVQCVHHDYVPPESIKMDGRQQTLYPRKNWSSLLLLNCDHPATRSLTPEIVNSATGAYLHQLRWVPDEDIGAIPAEWNWLEGWSAPPSKGLPKAVHFTRGGPWMPNWTNVAFADEWRAEWEVFQSSR